MRLTFVNGKFVLDTPDRMFPGFGDFWKCDEDGYCTTSVPAALRFRKFADSQAKKVFNRALVKFYAYPSAELPSFLDPHQRDGVEWILTRSRSYLAHAPGAGKTIEAIVAAWLGSDEARAQGLYEQTVFIVPPSLTLNWAREVQRFMGKLAPGYWPSIAVIPKSNHKERTGWNADFLIVPDSMLAKDWVLAELIKRRKQFGFVAVDEASRFKDPTAQRSVALFGGKKGLVRSPGLIQDARHAVLMDGSPMPNRPMELWGPTYAMAPEAIDFMGERDFGFRYCGAVMNDWGEWEFRHSSNEAELRTRLQKSFMHVVPESALKHPERRRKMILVNEDVLSREWREWERHFIMRADFSKLIKDSPGHPAMQQGEIATRRAELGLSKVPFIASYVKERAEKGESILVFAWHRPVCVALAKALKEYRPALIMGGTREDVRETWMQKFQAKQCQIIVGNIAAMGRGHNLQATDRIIFGEYSWTDELNKQCEKRASRRGSEKLFVPCDYIVVPNSMDEMILSSVFTKEKRVKRVIG